MKRLLFTLAAIVLAFIANISEAKNLPYDKEIKQLQKEMKAKAKDINSTVKNIQKESMLTGYTDTHKELIQRKFDELFDIVNKYAKVLNHIKEENPKLDTSSQRKYVNNLLKDVGLDVTLDDISEAVADNAAPNDEITLTVSSDGATKDEAVKNALRMAIEQTYGVFVSSNTDILNDDVIKDEVATVSSGNVKSFEILSEVPVTSGKVNVTIKCIVSVSNLITYAKNKGAECELDGDALASNIELQLLYKKNEEQAMKNLIYTTSEMLKNGLDYQIDMNNIEYSDEELSWVHGYDLKKPQLSYDESTASIPIKVSARLNKNGEEAFKRFFKQLELIAIPNNGKLKTSNANTYRFEGLAPGQRQGSGRDVSHLEYYFRSYESIQMLKSFLDYGINQVIREYSIYNGDSLVEDMQQENRDGYLRRSEFFAIIYTIDQWYGYCPDFIDGQQLYFCVRNLEFPIEKIKEIKNFKLVHN